jgi:cobalt/nickel transport system permease protein
MLFSHKAMHIPDGFLSVAVAVVGWILALAAIAVAIRITRKQLGERQIPMMGVLAAFIFAAQAINFPVAAGTSGHLLGGALAAILLGPWAGLLVMTSVLAVQGLLFQDGGLLAMGWNIVNMGVFGVFVGYAVYALVRRLLGESPSSRLVGGFVGAWLSVVIASIAASFELAASGASPLGLALPAMVGVHALIGLGEAVITTAAIGLVQGVRPEVLAGGEHAPGRKGATLLVVGLLVALAIALFSPLASPSPDGLEFVAEQQGFLGRILSSPFEILPDYTVPFINQAALTTLAAVALGTLVVFGLGLLVGRLVGQPRPVGK